jgi:hypothetical protein
MASWVWDKIKTHRYLLIVAVIIIAICGLGYGLNTKLAFFQTSADKINFYGFSLTVLAIAVAIIQAARNHDWNRRYTATTALLEVKDKLHPHSEIIHATFGYIARAENDAIKIAEIHEKICQKDGSGNFRRDAATNLMLLDNGGKEIHTAIRETLNLYEYIASGVYQGVFDKEIVAALMASNIIKVSSVFAEYIEHVNNDMYPRRKGNTWINIKTLGNEFRAKYRDDARARSRIPA